MSEREHQRLPNRQDLTILAQPNHISLITEQASGRLVRSQLIRLDFEAYEMVKRVAETLGWEPNGEQRQDSLEDQLKSVYRAATQLGCYDAADWLLRQFRSPHNEEQRK